MIILMEKFNIIWSWECKKLLAEAGYPDGKGFPTLKYKVSGRDQKGAEFLQEQFKKS